MKPEDTSVPKKADSLLNHLLDWGTCISLHGINQLENQCTISLWWVEKGSQTNCSRISFVEWTGTCHNPCFGDICVNNITLKMKEDKIITTWLSQYASNHIYVTILNAELEVFGHVLIKRFWIKWNIQLLQYKIQNLSMSLYTWPIWHV